MAKLEKIHAVSERSEHWIHVIYCGALYSEGHGLYATVGGVLGIAAFIAAMSEELIHKDSAKIMSALRVRLAQRQKG